MRKHFLLLFLMALLPLAGWAADEIAVGDYTVTVGSKYVAVGSQLNVTALKAGNPAQDVAYVLGDVVNASKVKVSNPTTPGIYYQLLKTTEAPKKVIYVPFKLCAEGNLEHIYDEATFTPSLESGVYKSYYSMFGWCDVWYYHGDGTTDLEADGILLYPGDQPLLDAPWRDYTEEFDGMADQERAANWYNNQLALPNGAPATYKLTHSWHATKTSNPDDIGIVNTSGVYAYPLIIYENGDTCFIKVEDNVGLTDQAQKFRPNGWLLWTTPEFTGKYFTTDAHTYAKIAQVLWIPEGVEPEAEITDAKSIADATITLTNAPYEYDGNEHKPIFTTAGETVADAYVTFPGATQQDDVTLVEGVDYEISWTSSGYTTPGTKTFTVTGIGAYSGTQNAEYKITGKKVVINPAYTFKMYGQPDPIHPNYDFEGGMVGDEDKETEITPYLLLKRVEKEGNDGQDVGAYQYYIAFSDDYEAKCKYEITILQENSNLVITKAPLTIAVTNNSKMYHAADPTAFEWTAVDATQFKYEDNADNVNITITRDAGEDVNATQDGQTITKNEGDNVPTYAFKGESKNYLISFATTNYGNEFLIVPTNVITGVTVTVKNDTETAYLGTNKYTYTGQEIQPGTGDLADNVIVKDGLFELQAGVDYDVTGYANNIHVADADDAVVANRPTVTITLKGSYAGLTKDGYFTIEKATLKVRAKSQQLQPGQAEQPLTLEYPGSAEDHNFWVNGEGTATAPASGDHAPVDYIAPTITKVPLQGEEGYKLKVTGGSAHDYTLDLHDGAITYGVNQLRIVADNQEKTFGEEDPTLTWKVYDIDNHEITEGPLFEALGGSQPYFTISREQGNDWKQEGYAITFDGPSILPQGIHVEYEGANFFIKRKPLTLKGDDCTKVYGGENPTFAASVWDGATEWTPEQEAAAGITNGSFYYVGVQNANWNGQRWVLESEDVNTDPGYKVQPYLFGSENIGNYSVTTIANGQFTITKADLTLTADNKEKGFGAADPELTVTANGFKFDDAIQEGDIEITRAKAGTEEGEAVGTYAITITLNEGKLSNYNVTLDPGTFTITAMDLYVVASDQAINYGQTINPYAVKEIYYKNANDEKVVLEWTENQIKEVLSLTTTVTKVGANKNAFTLVPANNSNYNVIPDEAHFTNGWLTIAALKEIPLDKAALKEIVPNIELKQVLQDHKGRVVDVILPARKMAADDWYDWVLPFDVEPRKFFTDTKWGYGVMETLSKATATSVSFGVTVNPIPANTPFIVKVDKTIEAADMKDMKFTGVTIDDKLEYATANPTSKVGSESTVQFIGLYEENTKDFDMSTRVLTREAADKPMAWWPGTNFVEGTFVRTRAYLQFPSAEAASGARIFVEDPNGGTTDITGVVTVNNAGVQGWYNMNGVKMQNAPVEKGVYIKDGKKVVIK